MQAAMVSRAFADVKTVDFKIIHTGQHFDQNMSEIFFEQLSIPKPYKNLEVHSLHHGAMVGRIMERLEDLVEAERPAMILIDGDTNSTLAGALVAAKLRIPSVHIESGLRSFDMGMPEEINRIVADNCCTHLYCPTLLAYRNLQDSNINGKAKIVGDVLYDAFCFYRPYSAGKSEAILRSVGLGRGGYALMTIHRQENITDGRKMREFFSCLPALDLPILFPTHPGTRDFLNNLDIDLARISSLRTITPVGYLEMLDLEANSAYILTDSGGVQREAFWSRKPLFVLRDTTEWLEQLDTGWATLIKRDGLTNLRSSVDALLANLKEENFSNFYGDGTAADKIVRDIADKLL